MRKLLPIIAVLFMWLVPQASAAPNAIPYSQRGTANGVATLNGSVHITQSQLAASGSTGECLTKGISEPAWLPCASGGSLVETNGRTGCSPSPTVCTNLAGGKESLNVAKEAGEYLTAYGRESGKAATTGAGSSDLFGFQVALAYKTGKFNALFGDDAFWVATFLEGETGVGVAVGEETTGARETFIGNNVGQKVTTGHDATCVGAEACSGHQATALTGSENVGVGRKSEYGKAEAITETFAQNVGVGTETLRDLTSGSGNFAGGQWAGLEDTTGEGNTDVGKSSGAKNKTGSFNDFIGNKTGETETAPECKLIIGNGSGAKQLLEGTLCGGSKELQVWGKLKPEALECTECVTEADLSKTLLPQEESKTLKAVSGKVTLNLALHSVFILTVEEAMEVKFENAPAGRPFGAQVRWKIPAGKGPFAVTFAGIVWVPGPAPTFGETENSENLASLTFYNGTAGSPYGSTGIKGEKGAGGSAGPEGPPITFKGAWNSGTTYKIGEAVSEAGSSYIAIKENLNKKPPEATNWGVLAEKGSGASEITWEAVEELNAKVKAYGAPFATTIRAGKSGDGQVHLSGVLKVETEVPTLTKAFKLPVADRPEFQQACFLTNVGNAAENSAHNGQWAGENGGLVFIKTNGEVETRGKWQITTENNAPAFNQCQFPSKG